MDSRLKRACVAAAVAIACAFPQGWAFGAAYRVAVARDGGAPAHHVAQAGAAEDGRVVWEAIGAAPFALPPEGPVLLEGQHLSPLPMQVMRGDEGRVALARGEATLVAFALRGSRAASAEAEAIEAWGEGFLLCDAATRETIAGHLRLRRRIVSSPWQSSAGQGAIEEEAEAAWAAIP